MKADWTAAWVHSLEGGFVAIKGYSGGLQAEGKRGGEKDYIYQHAYVLPSKRLAGHFLPPACPPTVMIAETVIKALAVS